MSLRDFFARNKEVADAITSEAKTRHSKNDIACDTAKLKGLIKAWTRNDGWKFKNFADFLELVGVKTPVKLREYDEERDSFKCITALGTEISISLFFSDWIDFRSQIFVTDGEETRGYITNSNSHRGKSVPKVTLQSKTIKRCGKKLESYYCEFFCHHRLKLDNTHILEVEIYEPEPDKYEKKSEIFVLQNCEVIEEYLLGLNNSLVVADVYEKMMEFLNFSNEDISKCGEIWISYTETTNEEKRVRGKILITNGTYQVAFQDSHISQK